MILLLIAVQNGYAKKDDMGPSFVLMGRYSTMLAYRFQTVSGEERKSLVAGGAGLSFDWPLILGLGPVIEVSYDLMKASNADNMEIKDKKMAGRLGLLRSHRARSALPAVGSRNIPSWMFRRTTLR